MENLFVKNILLFVILIFVGVIFTLIAIKVINLIFSKKASFSELSKNLSYSIVSSASVLCLGIIFSKIYNPLHEIFRILSSGENYIWSSIKYTSAFLGMAFLSWVIVIGISTSVISVLTKDIDELEELRNDNWKLAILLASCIIGLTLMISNPIIGLLESIIPYPNIPNLF
jgi:hypothetical protein